MLDSQLMLAYLFRSFLSLSPSWGIVVGALVAAAICGCSGRGGATFEATLNRAINGDPVSLNPQTYTGSDAATVLYDIGEGLVTYNGNGELAGGLAQSWSESADGKRIRFELREGLKWSDGQDLTSSDIVQSMRRLVDPAAGSPGAQNALAIKNASKIVSGELDSIELGVHAVDSDTVEIVLERSTPYFLQLLAHPTMQPLSKAALSDDLESLQLPVSNGPYRVTQLNVGSSIELQKNVHYWNAENVKINKVVYHIVSHDMEPIRFDAGELDITDNVAETFFTRYQTKRPNVLRVAPMLGVYYYGFNLKDSVLAKHFKLRKALSLAIDREQLVTKVLGRGEIAAYRFVPPGLFDSIDDSNAVRKSQSEREAEAQRLFDEERLAIGGDLAIELRVNSSGGHERIALAVASMWNKVLGINVDVRAEEFKVFMQNLRHMSDIDMFRLSWTGDYRDPYTFLQLFESTSGVNMTGYSDAEFDKQVSRANSTADPLSRQKFLYSAEDYLLDDVPVIPLYFYVSKHLVSERVVGWHNNLLDVHPSQYLELRNDP